MLGQLIRKEILEHLMSLRFAIACLLCFFVVLTSFFVRSKDYENVQADYHYDQAVQRTEAGQARGPWELLDTRVRTVQAPPNPLKVFVRGIDSAGSPTVQFELREPLRAVTADIDNPSIPLFPSIDLVVFVGLILSLMALVFGFDTICGEKQGGTLRLMLSYPVPRDTVLIAKWIGGYATLVMPYVIAVISLVALVMVQERMALDVDQWTRLGALFLLSLLYLAAVFSLAMLVSSLVRRSSTSIMLLMSLWVVLFLAVPNLSAPLASMLKPTPPTHEMATQIQAARQEVSRSLLEKEAEYHQAHNRQQDREQRAQRDLHFNNLRRQAELNLLRKVDQIDEQFQGKVREQTWLSMWVARVSPFGCFAMAAAELAGEGPLAREHFLEQVRSYQKDLLNYGYDAQDFWHRYTLDNEGQYPYPLDDHWDEPMPEFNYRPMTAAQPLATVAVDAGILAGLTVVFFLLNYVCFLRYDVR